MLIDSKILEPTSASTALIYSKPYGSFFMIIVSKH